MLFKSDAGQLPTHCILLFRFFFFSHVHILDNSMLPLPACYRENITSYHLYVWETFRGGEYEREDALSNAATITLKPPPCSP